jgi:hypothetical protein
VFYSFASKPSKRNDQYSKAQAISKDKDKEDKDKDKDKEVRG